MTIILFDFSFTWLSEVTTHRFDYFSLVTMECLDLQ